MSSDSQFESSSKDQKFTRNPQEVFAREKESISERRQRAWRDAEKNSDEPAWCHQKNREEDFVGLALSGGGIRSASVGLGVLQALCQHKLIRSVDYLSTVSGGGYIGSFFSSATVSGRVGTDKVFDDPQAGEPGRVRRLIYGGKYLYRPWEAANKYLIGLVLTNLSIVGGLVALAALLALLWRSLDTVVVRDVLDPLNLNSDVLAAFLPFCVLFTFWFLAWMLSYFRREAEAPGRWAQRWLYFAFAALLIGFAVLMANGEETKLGFLSLFLENGEKTKLTGGASKLMLGLLATALIPLLKPSKLIQMGMHPQGLKDRVVFRVATFAFLVGIPVAVVGFLGLRGIASSARDPNDNIRVGDIRDWPAFCGLLDGEPQTQGHKVSEVKSGIVGVADGALASEVQSVGGLLAERSKIYSQLDLYPSCWSRLGLMLTSGMTTENPIWRAWRNQRALEAGESKISQLFSDDVLTSKSMIHALVHDEPLVDISGKTAGSVASAVAFKADMDSLIKDYSRLKDDDDFQQTVASAELSYSDWSPNAIKEFNLYLLRLIHPELLFTEGKAYRWIVIDADQRLRRNICLSFALLLAVGLFVDMNRTSLHRFYRNRLKKAYIVPPTPARSDISLSELRTTELGAPYHIINATIELSHPRFLDELDDECRRTNIDRRDRQSFIFSQRFCGSTATGWMRTSDYESYLKENISLADAMALSGAASDPMLTNSLPITVLMTVLNLSLGQWMPNPMLGRPATLARAWIILRDWVRPVETSNYCFVSDGGFTDNLGVFSLLKRRCRVIIAVDASCDPDQEFADLGAVLRMARIQDGIVVTEPADPTRPLDTTPLARDKRYFCKRHFLVGRIHYPETETASWLIYLKPSLDGDEGSELLDYRIQDTEFPHDTTADQFYDYAKFESYRQLGVHMATILCHKLSESEPNTPLEERVAELADALAKEPADPPPLEKSFHRTSESAAEALRHLKEITQPERAAKKRVASKTARALAASGTGSAQDASEGTKEWHNAGGDDAEGPHPIKPK